MLLSCDSYIPLSVPLGIRPLCFRTTVAGRDVLTQTATVTKNQTYRARHASEISLIQKNWRAKNPLKRKAHAIVSRAITDGELTRPENCSDCGRKSKVQAHHEDYSKPLLVDWLCAKCHYSRHNVFKRVSHSFVFGENHVNAKLNLAQIAEVKRLHCSGCTLTAIAKQFRVSISNVHLIVKGKSWKQTVE